MSHPKITQEEIRIQEDRRDEEREARVLAKPPLNAFLSQDFTKLKKWAIGFGGVNTYPDSADNIIYHLACEVERLRNEREQILALAKASNANMCTGQVLRILGEKNV